MKITTIAMLGTLVTALGGCRSRSCVMRATGATCVEVDYREMVVSCPAG